MSRPARGVDTGRADRAALATIAGRAIPRERLKADGYHSLFHSSDLFSHGYRVRHWLSTRGGSEVLEYLPRDSDLPRLTAASYAEQAEIHLALGVNLVPPGCPWSDYRQDGLFDDLLGGDRS